MFSEKLYLSTRLQQESNTFTPQHTFMLFANTALTTEVKVTSTCKCKKGKVRPRTGHEGPEREYRYRSTLSLTSALDGGGWLTQHPGRFTPGKETRYPLYRCLDGSQGLSGRVRKLSPPPGFDPLPFQSVVSRCTD